MICEYFCTRFNTNIKLFLLKLPKDLFNHTHTRYFEFNGMFSGMIFWIVINRGYISYINSQISMLTQ